MAIQSVDVGVSNSVSIDGSYYTTVSIKNFKSTSIEKLEMCIPSNKPITDILGDKKLTLDRDNNVVKFAYIQPKESFSVIILSKEELNPGDIKMTGDVKIQTTFLKESKPVTLTLIVTISFYLVMMFISKVYTLYKTQKRLEKHELELSKEFSSIENQLEEKNKEIHSIKEIQKEVKKTLHETRIYYLIRVNDLNKELEFWRNTIRKLLYTLKDKTIAEDVINQVTETLKIYTTREKNNRSIDEIFYLANMMNNYDDNK